VLGVAIAVAQAQYVQPRGGESDARALPSADAYSLVAKPAFAADLTAAAYAAACALVCDQSLDAAQALKRKGRNLLITGGALSAAGIALYCSSWAMISDSSDAGKYLSIGGISTFAASIPFYITGSVLYVKGKKASLTASPSLLTLSF